MNLQRKRRYYNISDTKLRLELKNKAFAGPYDIYEPEPIKVL